MFKTTVKILSVKPSVNPEGHKCLTSAVTLLVGCFVINTRNRVGRQKSAVRVYLEEAQS